MTSAPAYGLLSSNVVPGVKHERTAPQPPPTTRRKDQSMIAPNPVYPNDTIDPLSDLGMLAERCPGAVHGDPHELARIHCCPEHEMEEAQRWMREDGIEVRA